MEKSLDNKTEDYIEHIYIAALKKRYQNVKSKVNSDGSITLEVSSDDKKIK